MRLKSFTLFLSLALLSVFLQSTPCFAAAKGPIHKLGRGIVHTLFFPFQLPKGIIEVAAETEPPALAPIAGITAGVGQGIYGGIKQLISGIVDVLTFPLPLGRNWEPIFDSVSLFPDV